MPLKKIFSGFPIIGIACLIIIFNPESKTKRKDFENFLQQEHLATNFFSDEMLKNTPKPTHPDKAAIQNYFMTIDPSEKRVPTERLNKALLETKKIASTNLKAVSADIQWEEVPSNIAGRVRALMYDPNDAAHNYQKVWAGTATGGLWYNNNINLENSPWQIADDLWSSLAVSCITYDPNNTQIFYAGTGEAQTALTIYRESSGVGVGIYKSTNGGQNWELLPSTANFKYITNIVVRDENGNSVIYAGVVSGFYKGANHESMPSDGLYRSTNGGQDWEQVLPNIVGSNVPYAPADVKIGPSGRIFVGSMRNLEDEGGSTILYSDSGKSGSWTIYNEYETIIKNHDVENIPGRVLIAPAPSNPDIVYAALGVGYINSWDQLKRSKGKYILKSTDGGESWQSVNTPTLEDYFWATIAWHCMAIRVNPNNENEVFIAGLDCYKSTNGGASWNKISDWRGSRYQYIHADVHNYAYHPSNPEQILVCTDGGVFMSNNSSASIPDFNERNYSFNCLQFYTCAIHPTASTPFYIGGLQDNGTIYYEGTPINGESGLSGGDGAYCFIDKNNPDVLISSVYHNYYFFFNNSNHLGVNTEYYNNGSGIFINPADYDHNLNILYANAVAFNLTFQNQLVRYTNITSNVGQGATAITITEDVNVPFSHIKVSPHTTNSSTLFVGTEAGRLFKIENAHNSPTTTTEIGDVNFPSGNISCVAIANNEEHLLVTFSNYGVSSIWQTYDGGATWTEKEGNLPDMPVRWAIYHPNDPKIALIATELGVWYTDELDQASPEWIPVNDGLANVRVDMLAIRESDHKVLAATHGRGLATTTFGPVGIEETVEKESDLLLILPNPNHGQFELIFNAPQKGQAELSVYNLQGQEVYHQQIGKIINTYSQQINLTNQAKGNYIIRFKLNNKFYTKRLVIY